MISMWMGLYYFGARYYDARMGRWVSTDPALQEGKYFPKPNDYDTEHDFYWYIHNDASGKLPGMGGVFNAVNLDVYHYAGNNPVKLVDPDGKAAIAGAIVGFISGVATEVALQASINVMADRSVFDNLDISDILVSGAIGAGTGAAGIGVIAQGKKFIDAYRNYRIANAALTARQIAIAAGKHRNPKKTEQVAKKVYAARKEMLKAGVITGVVVSVKKTLQKGFNLFDGNNSSKR